MPDPTPPKRDPDCIGALAKLLGYACLIAFGVGALGLDNPRFPDQNVSPIYWGRRVNQAIRGQ